MDSIGFCDAWYCHHSFILSSTSTSKSHQYTNEDKSLNCSNGLMWTITNVTFNYHNFNLSLPQVQEMNICDQQYNDTMIMLACLATNTQQNNPILAYFSHAVPIQCQGNMQVFYAGPCITGSLFVDALWWYTGQQVAFISSTDQQVAFISSTGF
ncbi:hypothetical protein ACA910_007443 [Epithemia clementina (nom. ined.)]